MIPKTTCFIFIYLLILIIFTVNAQTTDIQFGGTKPDTPANIIHSKSQFSITAQVSGDYRIFLVQSFEFATFTYMPPSTSGLLASDTIRSSGSTYTIGIDTFKINFNKSIQELVPVITRTNSNVITGIPIEIRLYSTSGTNQVLYTQKVYLISDCDFLTRFDISSFSCLPHSQCHPTIFNPFTNQTITQSYCECNQHFQSPIQSNSLCRSNNPLGSIQIQRAGISGYDTITSFDEPIHLFDGQTIRYSPSDVNDVFDSIYVYKVSIQPLYFDSSPPPSATSYVLSKNIIDTTLSYSWIAPTTPANQFADVLYSHQIITYDLIDNNIVSIMNLPPILIMSKCRYIATVLQQPVVMKSHIDLTTCNPLAINSGQGPDETYQFQPQGKTICTQTTAVVELAISKSLQIQLSNSGLTSDTTTPNFRILLPNTESKQLQLISVVTVGYDIGLIVTVDWNIPLPPGNYDAHLSYTENSSSFYKCQFLIPFTIEMPENCPTSTIVPSFVIPGTRRLLFTLDNGITARLAFLPTITPTAANPPIQPYLPPQTTFPLPLLSKFSFLLPPTSSIMNADATTTYTVTFPLTSEDLTRTCITTTTISFNQYPLIESIFPYYLPSSQYFIFRITNIGSFQFNEIILKPLSGSNIILNDTRAISIQEHPNEFIIIFTKQWEPNDTYSISASFKYDSKTITTPYLSPFSIIPEEPLECSSLLFTPSQSDLSQSTLISNGLTISSTQSLVLNYLQFTLTNISTGLITQLSTTSTNSNNDEFIVQLPISTPTPLSGQYTLSYSYTQQYGSTCPSTTITTINITPSCPSNAEISPKSFSSMTEFNTNGMKVSFVGIMNTYTVSMFINSYAMDFMNFNISNGYMNYYFKPSSSTTLNVDGPFKITSTVSIPSEPSCTPLSITNEPIIITNPCKELMYDFPETMDLREFNTNGYNLFIQRLSSSIPPNIRFYMKDLADDVIPITTNLIDTDSNNLKYYYRLNLPATSVITARIYQLYAIFTLDNITTPCPDESLGPIDVAAAPCPTTITSPHDLTIQFTKNQLQTVGYKIQLDASFNTTTTITAMLNGGSIAEELIVTPSSSESNVFILKLSGTVPTLPVGDYLILVDVVDSYCLAQPTESATFPFEVITPVFDDKIYPVEITINTTRRTITATWTTGNDHQAQLSQFTIHPMPPTPPTTEESLFPSFTTSYGLLSSINNKSIFSTLSIIPSLSTTQHTVELLLPTLPTHYFPNGFIIMLSPIQHSNDHVIQPTPSTHVTWQWGSFPSSCRTSLQCNNCNDYTSQCISTNIHNYYPPLPTSSYINWFESPLLSTISMIKKCTLLQLKCPLYFETNNDCTQCICQSDNCKKLTRSIQINLQLPQQFINIEQLQIFLQQQTYLIEHYLPLQLINLLQLNQYHINTTGYDIINTLQKTKRTQYQSTNEQLLIEYQTSIGIEQLTLTTLNPSLLNTYSQYINTLLLTITFQPTIPLTTTRYNIQQRFNYLLLQLIKLPLIEFNNNNGHKLLSMNITLQSLPINSNWINYSTLTTSSTSTTSSLPIATTLCSPYNQTNIKSNGLCPLPLPLMLSSSPYWSTCTNIDNNNNIKSQQIKPICYDYNGNTIESIELLSSTTISSLTTTILSSSLSLSSLTNICQKGYINYPFITTTSSRCNYIDNDGNIIPNNEPKQYPTELILTQQTKDISTIDIIYSGSILPLSWEWPLLYPQDATIDILFYPTLTSYSTLLTTTSLSLNSTIIIIPQLLSITTTSRIVIRCTQYRQLITTLPIQLIEPINLCPIINNNDNLNHCTINDINSQCNPISGLCQCKSSLYSLQEISQNTLDMKCVLPCYNKCNNNENDCIETSPYQCLQCPISFLGSLCQSYSNELCETSITNNNELYLNQYELYCNNNGYQKQCGQCTCNPLTSYIGDKCHICSLTDRNSLIELKQYNDDEINNQLLCSLPGTNYNETKIHCTQCICYPGYIGTRCEIPSIRGNVIFVNDNNQNNNNQNNIMQQQQESNNNNGNGDNNNNKYKYLSKDGQNVIIRDMALSLGIDPSFVTIQTITQIDYNNNNQQQQQQQQSLSISKSNNYLLSKFQSLLSLQSLQSLQPQQQTNNNNNNNKTTIVTYTISPSINGNGGNSFTNLNDLTNSWNNMQTNFNNLPISSPEVLNEIGIPSSASNATQPCNNNNDCELLIQCDPLLNNNCNDDDNTKNKKSTTIGIIIGIVVGIICVILLFIIVIFSVRYCRNNEKCCFKPEHNTRNGKSRKSGKSNKYHDDDNSHLELGDSTTTTTATTTMSNSSKQTKTNNTAQSSTTTSTSIDLEEITNHGESLPSGWTKHKHTTTGQILYVNQDLMISQKHSPNDEHGDNSGW